MDRLGWSTGFGGALVGVAETLIAARLPGLSAASSGD